MKFSLLRFLPPLALLLTCWGDTLTGQTLQPTVAPLVVQEVELEQANEVYLYLNNPSGDTLLLKWRQLEMSLPEGWDIDLCDYATCYVGVPPNGLMSPVFDTIQPYLKLIVQPGTTPGVAWCWFRVQDAANSANFLDLYFSLFTAGMTPTTLADPKAMRVFPNPAHDFLVIEHQGPGILPAQLFDATGRIAWQEKLAPGSPTRVAVAGWPAGLYVLQIGTRTQRILIAGQ